MSDLKDIWNEEASNDALSEEKLLAYLEGKLTDEQRHAFEARLAEESMDSDAIEGLQTLGIPEAQAIKSRLNTSLQQTLKKKRRGRRGIADNRWTTYAIIILLLIAVICFGALWVIKHVPK